MQVEGDGTSPSWLYRSERLNRDYFPVLFVLNGTG